VAELDGGWDCYCIPAGGVFIGRHRCPATKGFSRGMMSKGMSAALALTLAAFGHARSMGQNFTMTSSGQWDWLDSRETDGQKQGSGTCNERLGEHIR
jgi:hypothetical protein